tara:strand:- start:1678 stop:2184 length:507 start_codon:yes stop_codon:yes gene_type:complete
MKKYFFIILIFFIPYSSNASDGVYFIDVNLLLNNSNNGKKVINKLKKINDKNILEIKNYENDLKNQENEINKLKNIITEKELNAKVEDLKKKINLYREKKDKILKDYNDLKNQELETFFKKITPFIEEYMETNSIKLIIEKKNIFIANANYDISEKLIKFLNEKQIDD